MSTPSKSFGIDPAGRMLVAEPGDAKVATKQIDVDPTHM